MIQFDIIRHDLRASNVNLPWKVHTKSRDCAESRAVGSWVPKALETLNHGSQQREHLEKEPVRIEIPPYVFLLPPSPKMSKFSSGHESHTTRNFTSNFISIPNSLLISSQNVLRILLHLYRMRLLPLSRHPILQMGPETHPTTRPPQVSPIQLQRL
jgi:hypothetical protein